MAHPYKGLRLLSLLFRVLAWVVLVVGTVSGLVVLAGLAVGVQRRGGLAILAISALYLCLFQTLGGIVHLLLTLEERARQPE